MFCTFVSVKKTLFLVLCALFEVSGNISSFVWKFHILSKKMGFYIFGVRKNGEFYININIKEINTSSIADLLNSRNVRKKTWFGTSEAVWALPTILGGVDLHFEILQYSQFWWVRQISQTRPTTMILSWKVELQPKHTLLVLMTSPTPNICCVVNVECASDGEFATFLTFGLTII